MTPHRISLKLYLADGVAIDPSKILPLFHEWIRTKAVEGLLIDVADYKHVHHGPATVLVAHEMDYSVDLSEGRPGLVYTRKRPAPGDLQGDLRESLRRLLLAARALQQKAGPHAPVRFRTDELRVQVLDRLSFPNTPEMVAALRGELGSALARVFEGAGLRIEDAASDRRAPATLRVSAAGAPDLETLLARLG